MPQIEGWIVIWVMNATSRDPSFLSDAVDNTTKGGENPKCQR
jgi:hypothetical protein